VIFPLSFAAANEFASTGGDSKVLYEPEANMSPEQLRGAGAPG
jgi:hypothetical protein